MAPGPQGSGPFARNISLTLHQASSGHAIPHAVCLPSTNYIFVLCYISHYPTQCYIITFHFQLLKNKVLCCGQIYYTWCHVTSSGSAEFNFPGALRPEFCWQETTLLLHQTYAAGVLAGLLVCNAALTGNWLPTLREDYRFHFQDN